MQRMQALQRANEIRIARATLKRQIAAGRTSAAQAILSGPPEIEGMAVIELLRSQRSWGQARCRGLMRAIPLSENKTIGSMTDRQQRLLLAMLQAENQPRRLSAHSTAIEHSGRDNPYPAEPSGRIAAWRPISGALMDERPAAVVH
jgi:hypothetical protein